MISGSDIAKELCFSYEYDEKNRMVIKRVPGAGETWMVYDARDRLVMTQDENMRAGTKKWLCTKYDDLNRPIETGLWTESNDRLYHKGYADNQISYPNTSSNYELLTHTYYDNTDWVSGSGSIVDNNYVDLSDKGFHSTTSGTFPYYQGPESTNMTNGLVTGTKTKVLGTSSTYLYSVNFMTAGQGWYKHKAVI